MMTEAAGLTPHLDDAEIVRYIDDEGHALERARWRRHVELCADCAREIALLDDQARFVSGWLDRVSFGVVEDGATAWRTTGTDAAPAPTPAGSQAAGAQRRAAAVTPFPGRAAARSGRRGAWMTAPWIRAAAAVVLLAAPVAAIPALREWVGDRLAGRPAEEAQTTFRTAPAAADVGPQAAALRFVPASGVFTVEFDRTPAGGTLTLGRSGGAEALLEVLGSDGGDGPVISDARLRIGAAADANASYVLRLPVAVTAVNVSMAGRTVRTLDRAALDAGAVVPLAAATRP